MKSACKILRAEDVRPSEKERACEHIQPWLLEISEIESFLGTLRLIFNFVITIGKPENFRYFSKPLAKFLDNENFCSDPEGRRILGTVFAKISECEQARFREEWEIFQQEKETKISNEFVCTLVKERVRKAKNSEKIAWENFQKNFCIPIFCTTTTGPQSCTITTRRGQIENPKQNFPPRRSCGMRTE